MGARLRVDAASQGTKPACGFAGSTQSCTDSLPSADEVVVVDACWAPARPVKPPLNVSMIVAATRTGRLMVGVTLSDPASPLAAIVLRQVMTRSEDCPRTPPCGFWQ